MAVALTSFVQPMLIGTQSSSSSIQIITNEDHDICEDGPISVRPSPSPSPSLSNSITSPKSAISPSNDSLIGINKSRQDSLPYSDIGNFDFSSMNETNNDKLKQDKLSKTEMIEIITKDINMDIDNDKAKAKTKAIEKDKESDDAHDHDHNDNDNDECHGVCVIEDDEEDIMDQSVSSSQCRYCYSDILRTSSVSQCHCSGVLCRECLIRELKLTHGRGNAVLQCTVCKKPYEVKTEFKFNMKRDCKVFCGESLIHCGLKDEQYLLDSVGGKIGFLLVILGINTWILSTSLLFAFPPNGCPIELYYMVSVFDFAVGISTIWFIIKCRYLSPLFLSIMYFLRFLYILFGWIPSINLCNIYVYHHRQSNHMTILAYFLSFSIIASSIMCMCWIMDFQSQYDKYSKENGKLVLRKNHHTIEINNFLKNHNEADSF